jgi:hypothetical protein
MQQIPFLRLIYHQISDIINANDNKSDNLNVSRHVEDGDNIEKKYDEFFSHISQSCKNHNTQPIIFYHPTLSFDIYGKVFTNTDDLYLDKFKIACEKSDIIFIDMTPTFIDAYNIKHVFPNGFITGAVNTGHINKYGHKMLADKLVNVINLLELKETK